MSYYQGDPNTEWFLKEGADLLYYNTEIDPNQRVFGVPGASLYHANLEDASALSAGIKGEQAVGAELERLASFYPNTYVFHSVKLPGNIGDMDHVVVQGNRALLVDSKNWRHNAVYDLNTMTEDADIVYRDGEQFNGGSIHLRRQMIDWQLLFINSDVDVAATLVVANRDAEVIQSVRTGYSFVNINGLADVFLNTFDENWVHPLSDEMLRYYCNLVQDPSFNPNDANNYVVMSRPQRVHAPRKPATTKTKWLVFWSVMNYVLLPILFPLAGFSSIPLIVLAHKQKAKVIRENLGGRGLLTTVLVFSYMLLIFWVFCSALVAIYYIQYY